MDALYRLEARFAHMKYAPFLNGIKSTVGYVEDSNDKTEEVEKATCRISTF